MLIHPKEQDIFIILQKTSLEDSKFKWEYVAWNYLFSTYTYDHLEFLKQAKELWEKK